MVSSLAAITILEVYSSLLRVFSFLIFELFVVAAAVVVNPKKPSGPEVRFNISLELFICSSFGLLTYCWWLASLPTFYPGLPTTLLKPALLSEWTPVIQIHPIRHCQASECNGKIVDIVVHRLFLASRIGSVRVARPHSVGSGLSAYACYGYGRYAGTHYLYE